MFILFWFIFHSDKGNISTILLHSEASILLISSINNKRFLTCKKRNTTKLRQIFVKNRLILFPPFIRGKSMAKKKHGQSTILDHMRQDTS